MKKDIALRKIFLKNEIERETSNEATSETGKPPPLLRRRESSEKQEKKDEKDQRQE